MNTSNYRITTLSPGNQPGTKPIAFKPAAPAPAPAMSSVDTAAIVAAASARRSQRVDLTRAIDRLMRANDNDHVIAYFTKALDAYKPAKSGG